MSTAIANPLWDKVKTLRTQLAAAEAEYRSDIERRRAALEHEERQAFERAVEKKRRVCGACGEPGHSAKKCGKTRQVNGR